MSTSATLPSSESKLLIEKRKGVLSLILNNPAYRNALHPDIYTAGINALIEAEADPGIGAIVISGAGSHFCAGGNLNRLASNREKSPSVQADSLVLFHTWIKALRSASKPVIAAIEGNAAGAGFSLALACDLIIASEEARFSMAYVKVGLSPDGGATAHIIQCLPRQLAYELLLLGNTIDSPRLYTLGVVNQLTTPGQAFETAMQLAQKLAQGPRQAQQRIKHLLACASKNTLETQLEMEAASFMDGLFTPEAAEGIAAFLEKRLPIFNQDKK